MYIIKLCESLHNGIYDTYMYVLYSTCYEHNVSFSLTLYAILMLYTTSIIMVDNSPYTTCLMYAFTLVAISYTFRSRKIL